MFFLTILVVLAIVFRKELKSFIEDCISFFEKGIENPTLKDYQIYPMTVEDVKYCVADISSGYATEIAVTFNDGKKILVFAEWLSDVNAWRFLKKGDVCSHVVRYSMDKQIVEDFYFPKSPDEVRYCKDFKNSRYL